MTELDIPERAESALRLIQTAQGGQLTALGNRIVSQQAKTLLDQGLIRYAPGKHWIGYELTPKGKSVHDKGLELRPRHYF